MKLWCYTREPIDSVYYDPRLAYSLHLFLEDNGEITILNHNSGILFAKATENEDGSLNPRSIRNPYLTVGRNGGYEIWATRTLADGETDTESAGRVLVFETEDFITYTEVGLREMPEEYRRYVSGRMPDRGIDGISPEKLPKGAQTGNGIEIPAQLADRLHRKFVSAYHSGTLFPESISVHTREELENQMATRVFSDGTTGTAAVDWELDGVSFDFPGEYEISGVLHQDRYAFPVARNHADPCIGKWKDKYYFIATYDADHEHTMYIREADSIPELVNAEEHLILDSTTYEGIGGLLWAPELHVIGGRLCILHAATPGPFFEEASRVMVLKEGGNPVAKEDWEAPRRVVRADGSEICKAGEEITLDMTHFVWEGEDYVIWSQRQFLPKDLGAWLYMAKLNPQEPWKLASDPVVLTKPEYGWENNHTFVVEGPFALKRENKLFVTYSAAAVDTSYVVGLLSLEAGKELLQPANWKKSNYPILTSRSVPGEFGTGHNAYVTDEKGMIWNTYHARPGVDAPRCSGIRQVFFDLDGEPVLDRTEELAQRPEYSRVRTIVRIC